MHLLASLMLAPTAVLAVGAELYQTSDVSIYGLTGASVIVSTKPHNGAYVALWTMSKLKTGWSVAATEVATHSGMYVLLPFSTVIDTA